MLFQVIQIIINQLESAPISSAYPHTIGLELLGGEINRKSRDSCAYVHRDALYVFSVQAVWNLKTKLTVMRKLAGVGQNQRASHCRLIHLVHIKTMLIVEKRTDDTLGKLLRQEQRPKAERA